MNKTDGHHRFWRHSKHLKNNLKKKIGIFVLEEGVGRSNGYERLLRRCNLFVQSGLRCQEKHLTTRTLLSLDNICTPMPKKKKNQSRQAQSLLIPRYCLAQIYMTSKCDQQAKICQTTLQQTCMPYVLSMRQWCISFTCFPTCGVFCLHVSPRLCL